VKKRDIIQLIRETIKEVGADSYGDATNLTKGLNVAKSRFTKTGRPPGVMETQDTLSSNMLDDADIYHNELVGGYDEPSSYLDKRTGGTIIKIPHYNGPGGRGALFGRGTVDKIDRSKAAAKTVAAKLYYKYKQYIEDYEISDKSPAGVYGNIYLWVMFKQR
jgi:hypothetical protein